MVAWTGWAGPMLGKHERAAAIAAAIPTALTAAAPLHISGACLQIRFVTGEDFYLSPSTDGPVM